MARIFITGSSDGLGQMAAKKLIEEGHQVLLHARNNQRAEETRQKMPGAESVLIADFSRMEETIRLAVELNDKGPFDAIIHNAGIYEAPGNIMLAVNVIAPYILTSTVKLPERLVYISSQMHMHGNPDLSKLDSASVSYSDSKAFLTLFSMAVARRIPSVISNSVDPGWVPTKMGGAGAPDDLQKGFETQSWLAVSNDPDAMVSGRHLFHKKEKRHLAELDNIELQDKFIDKCSEITGVKFPS